MRNILLAILAFSILLFLPINSSYSEENLERVLVITVDGLRPDAITKTTAPNLSALIKEGAYTPSAKTVDPPKTLPSHTSLVTGLTPKRHLTFFNQWIESLGYIKFDTIFTIAKKEGFSTSMFVGKDKLNYIAVPGSIDKLEVIKYGPSSVEEISESFRNYVKTDKPQITLIHFPEPDIPGHKYGWMSDEYIDSVKRVDKEIGKIVSDLKKAGIYNEMLLIITADHGGKGKTHKGNDPLVTTIPWLAVGRNIKQNYQIQEQVYIYDTAPTILKALDLTIPKDIDGQVVKEIFIH